MSNKRPHPSSTASTNIDPNNAGNPENPEDPSPKRQRSSPQSDSASASPSQQAPLAPSTSQTSNLNTQSRPSSSGHQDQHNSPSTIPTATANADLNTDVRPSETDTTPARPLPLPADPPAETEETPNIPQKRAMVLREFLEKMDDYAPIIPDTLTTHYLTLSGLPPPPSTPLPLARLLALAVQKFIADLAGDAYQHARIRSGASGASGAGVGGAGPAGAAGAAGPAGVGAGPGSGAPATSATKAANIGTQRPGFGGIAPAGGSAAAGKQGLERTVLTMEDLGMAVGEYGVNVRRGEFYR